MQQCMLSAHVRPYDTARHTSGPTRATANPRPSTDSTCRRSLRCRASYRTQQTIQPCAADWRPCPRDAQRRATNGRCRPTRQVCASRDHCTHPHGVRHAGGLLSSSDCTYNMPARTYSGSESASRSRMRLHGPACRCCCGICGRYRLNSIMSASSASSSSIFFACPSPRVRVCVRVCVCVCVCACVRACACVPVPPGTSRRAPWRLRAACRSPPSQRSPAAVRRRCGPL
jgi:hypothetical protein